MSTVDDFLAGLDAASRAAFTRIRDVAVTEVPDVEQGTSYGMAALRYRGKPLLGFRVAREHLTIAPFSPAAVDAARDALTGYGVSKGTVRFTPASPPPDEAVRRMVRARADEIEGRVGGH